MLHFLLKMKKKPNLGLTTTVFAYVSLFFFKQKLKM
jgi:hypothetical protein